MDNYYDQLVAELILGGMSPKDNYAFKRLSPAIGGGADPNSLSSALTTGMSERDARSAAGRAENTWLSAALGSKREKGKNERTPEGSYAMSWYPGQQMDIEMAYGRVIPPDAEARMSSEQREAWMRKVMEWQNMQRSMLPQHGNFLNRTGGF